MTSCCGGTGFAPTPQQKIFSASNSSNEPIDSLSDARNFTARLHRLDAGSGMHRHVSDALLRLVADTGSAQNDLLHFCADRRNTTRAALSVSRRNFIRPGHRQTLAEGCRFGRDISHDIPTRRRDLCAWALVSTAGVCDRSGVGSGDGLIPRRYSQYDWRQHDPDGSGELGSESLWIIELASVRVRRGHGICNCPADATFVDHVAATLDSVADSVLHQWSTQSWGAAAVALSYLSVGRVRICGLSDRILVGESHVAKAGDVEFPCLRRVGNWNDLFVPLVRCPATATLCDLRLLAHEPEFLFVACG